jgi:DNA-binding winged helix-turn-helix (wHTH) protein
MRVTFGSFEFDPKSGELRKEGRLVRLQVQPARLLTLLIGRPGEVIGRDEIQRTLWPDGRFVEFEHAINTAVKKVREAIEDESDNPKFIETIPKVGYRFIAAVNPVGSSPQPAEPGPAPAREFVIPYPRASWFAFLLIQLGYLLMYLAALYDLPALESALSSAGFVPVGVTMPAMLVLAMCGIAVRIYLVTAIGWRHPAGNANFLRLFPFVLVLDALWSASPVLVANTIGAGIALAGVAGLAYLPFGQRTLIRSIYAGN